MYLIKTRNLRTNVRLYGSFEAKSIWRRAVPKILIFAEVRFLLVRGQTLRIRIKKTTDSGSPWSRKTPIS